ncbi:hypothetical protein, partial [uncultured Ruminococcus sp.]|uniref:hypothetical protein n=1 Tax=uncultured Ruminococcus sp. TaxID=165186 RepID=UPI00258AB92C
CYGGSSRLYAPPGDCGESPLTFPPISNVKRVMLRRQQPPVRPAGGVLLVRIYCDSFLWNLRVILCRIVQVKREFFSFFASFFLFSKEKKKRNSL